MRDTTLAGVAVATLVLLGCPSVGAFGCLEDSQCDLEGTPGECLPDGDCAYEDGDCPSGLRRSPNAAAGAGDCVDAGASATGTTTTQATSTGPLSCGFRKEISIDTALLSNTEPLVDYPALIAFSDSDLVGASESQVFFTDESGGPLPFEIETFDPPNGAIEAWVRLPAWEVAAPLSIDLRFGDDAVVPSTNSVDAWAEHFVAVWHFDEALQGGDGEVIRDSTRNAEQGFTAGDMTAEQTVAGIVGNGLSFDGIDDSVDVAGSWLGTLASYTVSLWVRVDDLGAQPGPFFSRLNGDNLYPRCRKTVDDGSTRCQHDVDTVIQSAGSGNLGYGQLAHVALRWDSQTGVMEMFIDGDHVATGTPEMLAGNLDGGDFPLQIGRIEEFGSLFGMIDEFRISNVVLPEDWIAADHASQVLPGNLLLSVAPAEPAPCP